MGAGQAKNYMPAVKYGARWYPSDMVVGPPVKGSYFFVDGGTGSDANAGDDWEHAFSTIRAGVEACTSRKGDVVFVAPPDDSTNTNRYPENVLVDKRNIKILGVGSYKDVRIRADAAATKATFQGLDAVSYLGISMYVVSTSTDVEIAGLRFDPEGVYCGLYIGDGYRIDSTLYASGADTENSFVHHCTFTFGSTGLYFDGMSNDSVVENCLFYKQTDNGIYIGPGGTQQSSRCRIRHNEFNGCEDYGVYVYSHAQNKNHVIGPGNVFMDQASATEMTNPVYLGNATPTNAVIGNWMACETDNAAGTHDQSCGNYDGTTGASVVHVDED